MRKSENLKKLKGYRKSAEIIYSAFGLYEAKLTNLF